MVVGDVTTAIDVLVIGGGPAGYVSAIRAAQLGRSVEMVLAEPPGGTCLYRGCIPLKALLAASRRFTEGQPDMLAPFGIEVPGPVSFDFGKMQSWKEGIVKKLGAGVQQLVNGNRIESLNGKGWFISANEVRVEAEYGLHRISFEKCVIAVGSEALALPGLPFDGAKVLTPEAALGLAKVPETLTIFGQDYIAVEMATLFSRLGSRVTLLLPGEKPLPELDPAAIRLLSAGLRKMGIQIIPGALPSGLKEDQVAFSGKGDQMASGPLVVAIGTIARTGDLGLETTGVKLKESFIKVNSTLQTDNPSLFGAGDCTGLGNLAAEAIKMGKTAAENLGGLKSEFSPQARPIVIHTSPEIAAVGLTPEAAGNLGYEVVTGRFPLAANGKALTLGSEGGIALIVAEKGSGVLLGFTFVGPGAGEIIGEATLALEMGATLTDLSEILHPHPGLGEALGESAEAALNQAIHTLSAPLAGAGSRP